MVAAEATILLDLAILLIFAKVLGEVFERLKVHSMVGEIAGGLIAGPILHLVAPSPFLAEISLIGVTILLFLIGLETNFDEVKGHVYQGSILGTLAAVSAFLGGLAVGYFVLGSLITGVVIGVALMSTSTAIPVKLLIDRGEFRSKVGQMLVAVAMADDIVTILSLSMLSSFLVLGTLQIWHGATLFLSMIGFILLIVTAGSKFIAKVLHGTGKMRDSEVLAAIPLAIVFLLAWVSENLGIAAVTGAFLAGMAVARSSLAEHIIVPKVKTVGEGFFIPLFFAYSALLVDLSLLAQYWWLVAVLIGVGVATKAVVSGWVAGWFGFHGRDRKIIGLGMVPRGEYGIVVSQIALALGAISNQIYGAVIALVVFSIIITPVLFATLGKGYRGYGS
jgi:Kef-type K+ transport system membrane component KefB